MKNLLSEKYFIHISNLLLLLCFLAVLSYELRYSFVSNDDIIDLIDGNFCFFHGRFFTELISIFLVKTIPNILNIHIQDFAFISEGLYKALCFVIIIDIIGRAFFFNRKLDISICFINLLTFFTLFSILSGLEFTGVFSTLQFFNGYLFPIIFFIILWYKLLNAYIKEDINEDKSSKLQLFSIIIISMMVSAGNEELGFVSFVLALFVIIENILKREHTKKEFIISILSIIFMSFFVYTSKGFIVLWNAYNLNINFYFTLTDLKVFLQLFFNVLILNNLFFWIPIIMMIIALHKDKKNHKIVKYNIFSYFSFLLFFFFLFFLGETNVYKNTENYIPITKYWITYSALLMGYKFFLYFSSLFLAGQLLLSENKHLKYLVIAVFLTFIFLYNIQNYEKIKLSDYNARKTMYITDKFSVFYFRKKQTAILPKDDIELVMPTSNDLMPIDLETDSYKNKIYYPNKYSYLRYVKYVYGVDTQFGMTFKPYNKAMNDFINEGGHITKEELLNIKFSNIIK